MANPYIYYVVTVDGAALIAQATAANPIVYVAALSKATAAESDADLSTKPASWYDGKVGDIAAVSAVGNNARIVAVWGNSGSAQPAKSLAVTARLASQTDAEAVVMTAMSDPDSTVMLPGEDDVQGGVEVPFNVALNASGDVEVTPGAAASIADLARFVSLHKAGDPTQGEAQTIRGEKTFADGLATSALSGIGTSPITLASSIIPSGIGAKLGAGDHMFSEAFVHYITGVADATRGTCYSYCGSGGVGSTYSMNWYVQSEHKGLEAKIYLSTEDESGTATKEVAGIRLRDSNSAKAQMELSYNKARDNGIVSCAAKAGSSTEATLRLDALSDNPQFVVDMTQESGDRVAMLCLNRDCELYLESDLHPTRIGKGSAPIDYVIAYNLMAKDHIYLYSQNANNTTAATISLHSHTTDAPAITARLEDSSGNVLADVTLDADDSTAMCYLYMDSDIYETCIGKPTRRIEHLYAWDLQGIIPHPKASNADPPVGSIVMLEVSDNASYNINVGDQLQGGIASRSLKLAVWDAGAGEWVNRGNALGSSLVFRALSGGSPSSTHANYVLAIRVQ